jgi:UrcA family protein
MNRKRVALVATRLAFVGSAAAAAPLTETREVTVHYADLNLESAAGIESLYARIRAAAKQVCGTAERTDFGAQSAMRTCREAAVASAVAKIGNAALAARHANKPEARYARADGATRS